MKLLFFFYLIVKYKSMMMYRGVEGVSGSLLCFEFFVHVLRGSFPHVSGVYYIFLLLCRE
jgi:hypothetical protein